MSYKAELQNSNLRLQDVLDRINEMPEGGGGGGEPGGGSGGVSAMAFDVGCSGEAYAGEYTVIE